jgi:DUF4097 and DUF4098 domain-containing protein YvlB
MHQETRNFPAATPIFVDISDGSGSVELRASAVDQVTVEVSGHHERTVREATIEFTDNVLRVSPRPQTSGSSHGLDIRVTVPERSSAKIRSGSADVRCAGTLQELRIGTGSGEIQAEHVTGDAELKSGSGGIEIDTVGGTAKLNSASGDVRVNSTIRAELGTASGDISARRVESSVHATTASGSIDISSLSGSAALRGVSGDVHVGLAPGLAARLDVSSLTGEVSSELAVSDEAASGDPVDIAASTVSGDISIRRAAAVSHQ